MRGAGEGDAGAGAGGDPGVPMNSTAGDPSVAGEPKPPGTGIELPDDAVQPDSDDEVAPVLPIETTTVLPQEKVKSFRSGGRDPRIRMYRTIHARGFRSGNDSGPAGEPSSAGDPKPSGKDSGMMNKLMESIMDQLEKGEPIKMVVDVKPQDVEGWLSKDQGSSNATIFPASVDGSVQALNGTGPGTGSLGTRSLKSKNMEAMDDACCMAKWWHCCGK